MPEDCYFYIDYTVPIQERSMSVICVQCHDEHMPDTGMFWAGSNEGYGPYDYRCNKCEKLIHEHKEHDKDDEY